MRSRYFKVLAALACALTLCAFAPVRAAAHDPRAHGATGAVVYTCPMHPEVKSKKKGTCPKCKMDLRPARSGAASAAAKTGDVHETRVASKMSIPDVELLDQDGRAVRFYTDLVKG